MRHIIPISGKDSLTTAIVAKAHNPSIEFEYIYNATGAEPPEIFAWLEKATDYLKADIQVIGSDLTQIIYDTGMLPSRNMRFCTRLSKIKPMLDYLGDGDMTIYYGLRADEPERAGLNPTPNVTVRYPLRNHNIDIHAVYAILQSLDLMPPAFFWHDVYNRVVAKLGEHAHLIERLPEHIYQQLFAWRTRLNCYYCPFQRQYEWVGLYEHHPRLFAIAQKVEREVGADGYNWQQGHTLADLVNRRGKIKDKRAHQIFEYIMRLRQLTLFDDMPVDELTFTSCGLTCGK